MMLMLLRCDDADADADGGKRSVSNSGDGESFCKYWCLIVLCDVGSANADGN